MKRAMVVLLALVLLAGFAPVPADASGASPPQAELVMVLPPVVAGTVLVHYAKLESLDLKRESRLAGLNSGAFDLSAWTMRPSAYTNPEPVPRK